MIPGPVVRGTGRPDGRQVEEATGRFHNVVVPLDRAAKMIPWSEKASG